MFAILTFLFWCWFAWVVVGAIGATLDDRRDRRADPERYWRERLDAVEKLGAAANARNRKP